MLRRLIITVLACLALMGGAVPAFAVGGGEDHHRAHAGHAVTADQAHCQNAGMDCESGHGDAMAGCVNGSSCVSPGLGASLPVQYSAVLTCDPVVWQAQERRATALSVPPTLRPPRAVL